jgi:hypothetical protein
MGSVYVFVSGLVCCFWFYVLLPVFVGLLFALVCGLLLPAFMFWNFLIYCPFAHLEHWCAI